MCRNECIDVAAKGAAKSRLLVGRHQIDALPGSADRVHFLDRQLSPFVETSGRTGKREPNQQSEQTVDDTVDAADSGASPVTTLLGLLDAQPPAHLDE